MTNSLLYSFLAHGPTTWWPRTRVPSRQNQQTIVRARSYSPELLICSRYLCHATSKTENSLLFLAHGPTTWWPRTRVPSRQNPQTIVRARSYSPELLICSRYLCHATSKTENSLFICMSTCPRSNTRRSID